MCRRLGLGCAAVNRTALPLPGVRSVWRLRSHSHSHSPRRSVSCVAPLGCEYCSLRLVWRVPELLDLLQSVPECTNASTCQCAADRTRCVRFAASGGSAPGGPWYFTVSRSVLVAVDAYGCFKSLIIVVVRPAGHQRSGRCMGKARMEGRRVESSRRRDSDVMSSECVTLLFQRPASSASSILRPASSVLTPQVQDDATKCELGLRSQLCSA